MTLAGDIKLVHASNFDSWSNKFAVIQGVFYYEICFEKFNLQIVNCDCGHIDQNFLDLVHTHNIMNVPNIANL